GTAFSHDVPPYVIAGGNPMEYGGPNTTMMDYAEIDKKVQSHIANAYRLLFHGKTSVFDVIKQIRDQVPDSPEIQNIIRFLDSGFPGDPAFIKPDALHCIDQAEKGCQAEDHRKEQAQFPGFKEKHYGQYDDRHRHNDLDGFDPVISPHSSICTSF
ncbi:MAG: hypothetical protein IKI23_00990, partial [Lachnospiraceae bacterium]|nr:hypothetical protein [Lachnospiraceae bacterium]